MQTAGPLGHLLAMASLLQLAVVLLFLAGGISAQLSPGFYSQSCPGVFAAVRSVVQAAISKDTRMGAAFVRFFFHDCFVNGCDGSLLLDDVIGSFKGEKNEFPNNNSLWGFDVVDGIKSQVEAACPGVVSCADILAIAARDSVVLLGGPDWDVKLGRRDARTANKSLLKDIPPAASSLSDLISRFQSKGLSARDMVALSGSHTIGKARCVTFRARIYNDTNIDSSFAKKRQSECPSASSAGNDELADLDVDDPATFDNSYFKNLLGQRGLLHSDQELYNGGSTDSLVRRYSGSLEAFSSDFAAAMIRMGDISPLTGSSGEIRKNCRMVN